MTKKDKKDRNQEEAKVPIQITEDADLDLEEEDLPVRVGMYTQQELAFGDIMRSIFGTLTEAYQDGMTRKEIRKASGVKKKTLRRIESMDMSTPIGDVLRVLAAANKTLCLVPLNGASTERAVEDTMTSLEDVLSSVDVQLENEMAEEPTL